MGSSNSARRTAFWRSDWFLALGVTVAVLVLHQTTDAVAALERRFYDMGSTATARVPSDRIAIIAIDDRSIANIGRWPWPRDVHAQLIDKLAEAKAKTIVNTTFFFEPQTDRGLGFIRRIKDAIATQAEPSPAISELIDEAEKTLDADARLAESMRRAGNVLIPAVFELGEPLGKPDQPLPAHVLRSTVVENTGYSVPAVRGQYPIESIGAAAVAIGHLNQLSDADGAVREDPLLVGYYGRALPSMALLAAASSINLQPADLRLAPGEEVRLGRLRVPTDIESRMLPQFYRAAGGKPPFQVDSFHDVISGKIATAKYADKIVLIGATAAGVGTSFAVPGHPGLAPVEMLAHITSSILAGHFLIEPTWAPWAALGALLVVAAYLIVLLPRLSAAWGAGGTAVLLAALVGSEYLMLAQAGAWLKLVLPAVLLGLGHLALTTRRFLVTERGMLRADDESAETNRMMGLSLQGQGQLDMAFDRFRRVPLSDPLMDNLYSLALDFERKRQFNKAQAIYEHMATWNAKYKDLPVRLNRARNLADTVMLGGAGGHPGGTLVLDDGAVEKPMLGRYQLERELGKGAMGVVYLGRDPMIGRTVAIKTLALSREFEGTELDEARARFFREAETAGRLAHPNIVTIYDAGEEHDLAYIAMEFLKGRDLVDHVRADQLLPPGAVVSIGIQVAQALAYAHAQNVVHRDIKPANIMYEPQAAAVKVTDFGIARITDSSRTRTGMILGTPSYMSPEQIAGRRADGRSDLYSLGVTLFQLFTGELPFRGDSMAELMYKISNQEAPDLCSLRPELPPALAAVLARALAKQPDSRFADGEAFAAELRACLPLVDGLVAAARPAEALAGAGGGPDRGGYDATQQLEAPRAAATAETAPPTLATAAGRTPGAHRHGDPDL